MTARHRGNPVRRRGRRGSGLRALALLAVTAVLAGSAPQVISTTAASATTAASTTVTKSKTVGRDFLDNGVRTVIDSRTVSVSVSQTTNLKSLQQVTVNWSGAHQTAGIIPDSNSDLAMQQEYSFDLFECRGVDSTSVPASQQVSPQTCWTQFADERFQAQSQDNYPGWRSDEYAASSDRNLIVNPPSTTILNGVCRVPLFGTVTQRWLPYQEVGGQLDYGGPGGCAGEAPEASPINASSLSLPSNETFGVTDAAGQGSANFDIFTGEDHASLGCSVTVACSLVAVPIEGISCDPSGSLSPSTDPVDSTDLPTAQANCEQTGKFTLGQPPPPGNPSGDPAVDGTLWWSASNWRNRIVFPLTFAAADNVCSVINSGSPVQVYGSELMTQATTQWQPAFCLNPKLFNLKHVQTPEPEARTLLGNGSINAAMTSYAPSSPYSTPTVTTPISLTGWGIAFSIDDSTHHLVTSLKLDARLLAKLMTESYPDQEFIKQTYPATYPNGTSEAIPTLTGNPLNITLDPEFRTLNPTLFTGLASTTPLSQVDAAATILLVDSDSDVIHALTSYINADPDARAWLNGTPDPWGMRVNPNYENITLPLDAWPLLDTYEPKNYYVAGINNCLYADPVPYLPLVSSPVSRLFNTGLDMQYSISQTAVACAQPDPNSLFGTKMVATGRQSTGFRFMLGLVSLGDAARENLHIASLATTATLGPKNTETLTFAGPSTSSMLAAAKLMTVDPSTNTWTYDYATARSAPTGANAYPGTLLVDAAVPTKGLSPSLATDYSEFLNFAAGPGQTPGVGLGELPPGYVPLTSGNGLGTMVAYTKQAALAVAGQCGVVPTIGSTAVPCPSTSKPSTPSTTTSSTPTATASPSAPASSAAPTSSPTTSAPTSSPTNQAVLPAAMKTPKVSTGVAGILLPVLLLLVVLAGGSGLAVRLTAGRKGAL